MAGAESFFKIVIELMAGVRFNIKLILGVFYIHINSFNQCIHRVKVFFGSQVTANAQLQLFSIEIIIEFMNNICFLLNETVKKNIYLLSFRNASIDYEMHGDYAVNQLLITLIYWDLFDDYKVNWVNYQGGNRLFL